MITFSAINLSVLNFQAKSLVSSVFYEHIKEINVHHYLWVYVHYPRIMYVNKFNCNYQVHKCKIDSFWSGRFQYHVLNSENFLRDGETIAWLLYRTTRLRRGRRYKRGRALRLPPRRIVLSSLLLDKILGSSPPYVHSATLTTTAVTNDACVYIRARAPFPVCTRRRQNSDGEDGERV